MKTIVYILSLLSIATLLGCQNTVAGFGKDMQNTGQEIQKSANS